VAAAPVPRIFSGESNSSASCEDPEVGGRPEDSVAPGATAAAAAHPVDALAGDDGGARTIGLAETGDETSIALAGGPGSKKSWILSIDSLPGLHT
jgi:hypothetical protein